ncbi:MAG: hypothetical protein ONB31_05595 [candidate division KSB1 bacterium]|nr:hypothetical protein [candidate division KSB1 bacterium]MDZ7334228.1 hypothetical protein [candidate division KSB1 bacterium]MDZ7358446.1 hypothetical protein [candidate division KSB1 bacterium]MDZ7401066.1 hypothetical protein [candidate division KSB1 bacterium]
MKLFDRTKLNTLSLSQRTSKSAIERIAWHPSMAPPPVSQHYRELIERIAVQMLDARQQQASVILVFGAHLIKNGLGPLVKHMLEQGYVSHVSTNGAGSIHDWEFAFHGYSEEDVRANVHIGQFGIWEETGKYINLAVLLGAARGLGYGEAIGEMIHQECLMIPSCDALERQVLHFVENHQFGHPKLAAMIDLLRTMQSQKLSVPTGRLPLAHPFKQYSFQAAAFGAKVPVTIHPGFGYDIIYTSRYNCGAAFGRASEVDWLRFAHSVSQLEGGVYLSIGSAIMSPMIFEKALSMARNVARQSAQSISDFLIVVNDIQPTGEWSWGTGQEPPKDSPAYFLRFCKTFDRMGAREMHYLCLDNRAFLMNLYHCLRQKSEPAPENTGVTVPRSSL